MSKINYFDKLTEKLTLTLNILCSTNDSISTYYTPSDIVVKMLDRLYPGNTPEHDVFAKLCARASALMIQKVATDKHITRSNDRISCVYASPYDGVKSRKTAYGYKVPGKIISAINKDMVAESAILSRQAEDVAKNPLEAITALMEGLTYQQLSEIIAKAVDLKDIAYHSEKMRVAELASKLKAV